MLLVNKTKTLHGPITVGNHQFPNISLPSLMYVYAGDKFGLISNFATTPLLVGFNNVGVAMAINILNCRVLARPV